MSWYDIKQAAVDPDNPAANEQIPFSEWNAMTAYLKDKIVDKTVNTAAIGNDKVLVYKTATSTFVFEAQSAVGAINDLSDVTISGVPADNEVLAYDTGTSEFINQTAAEAGLATVTNLASYLALAGGTMAGNLNMGDYLIDDVDDIQAYDTEGVRIRDSAAATKILLATNTYSFAASATGNMGSYGITNVLDPTSAQHASTKNYDDTHLFTKEAVTSFTDGYVPVYRTASGKFEMEEQSAALGLPVADTNTIVKGSADGTKLMRFEVGELTTGMTRVMTVPDKNITLCDTAEVMLLSGTQEMAGDLDMDDNQLYAVNSIRAPGVAGTFIKTLSGDTVMVLANGTYSFIAGMKAHMNGYGLQDIGALSLKDATELTIATGAITVTQSYHTIDTEADAATDDLDTISGGTAGQELIIRAADSARTVIAKDATGNLQLDADMSLNNIHDTLSLIYDGVNWLETGRSNIPGLANKYLISDDLLHSHDAEASTSSTGYTKLKTITINTLNRTPSTIRIKFDLKSINYNTVYGRIYKNGAAVGTIRSRDVPTYATFSEDLEFADGDTLEIYAYTTSGTVYVNNFRVYGTTAALTLKEAVENSDVGETTPFAATNS